MVLPESLKKALDAISEKIANKIKANKNIDSEAKNMAEKVEDAPTPSEPETSSSDINKEDKSEQELGELTQLTHEEVMQIEMAKRVSSEGLLAITEYNEAIKNIAEDVDAINRDLSEINKINDEIKQDFTYFSNLLYATEDALVRATQSNSLTISSFYHNDVKGAKAHTDVIKNIKKEYEGADSNPPYLKKGYNQLAKEIKEIIIARYSNILSTYEDNQDEVREEKTVNSAHAKQTQEIPSADTLPESTETLYVVKQQTTKDSNEQANNEQNMIIDSIQIDSEPDEVIHGETKKQHFMEATQPQQLSAATEKEEQLLDFSLAHAEPLVSRVSDKNNIKGTIKRDEDYYWRKNVRFPAGYSDEKMRNLFKSVKFIYDSTINKFRAEYDESQIEYIYLSAQIAYTLGFEDRKPREDQKIAKYAFNIAGGINSFCVYTNGLTENIIVGNELTSLLRVVSVSGNHGDTVENIYDSPVFSRVMPRQINEIEIELRTLEGKLVPFQFGVTIVTLLFKKVIVF